MNIQYRIQSKLLMTALAVCLGLSYTTSAQAEWYYGANVANTQDSYLSRDTRLDDTLIANPYDAAENPDAYKLYGGFKPSNYFSLEVGYSDLGRGDLSEDAPGTAALLWKPGSLIADIEAEGLFISGIGSLPLSDTSSIYLRAGFFNIDLERSQLDAADGLTGIKDRPDLFYGLGADYEFNKSFGIRAEWERFSVDEEDIDLFSAGLKFNF